MPRDEADGASNDLYSTSQRRGHAQVITLAGILDARFASSGSDIAVLLHTSHRCRENRPRLT